MSIFISSKESKKEILQQNSKEMKPLIKNKEVLKSHQDTFDSNETNPHFINRNNSFDQKIDSKTPESKKRKNQRSDSNSIIAGNLSFGIGMF